MNVCAVCHEPIPVRTPFEIASGSAVHFDCYEQFVVESAVAFVFPGK